MGRQYDDWNVSSAGSANSEDSTSKAAPGSLRQLIITGFTCQITGAAIGAVDPQITLEDANNVILYRDHFGALAARGTRVGVVFGEEYGIKVPIGVGCKIVVEASGAGSGIIATNMWGIEV